MDEALSVQRYLLLWLQPLNYTFLIFQCSRHSLSKPRKKRRDILMVKR